MFILVLFLLVGCGTTNVIKKDYESLNKNYLKVTILDNNIEKINMSDVKSIMNKNGIVYFCMPSSNYCRNNINILIEIVNDLSIKTYYVDLTNIRNSEDYNNFVNEYSQYIKELEGSKYIFDGDIMVFSYNKVIEYLSVDNFGKDYNKEITEEEKKIEYKRLYDGISKLIDSESCDHENTGC